MVVRKRVAASMAVVLASASVLAACSSGDSNKSNTGGSSASPSSTASSAAPTAKKVEKVYVNDLFDLRLLLETKALTLILENQSFFFRPIFESMEQFEGRLKAAEEGEEISSSETSQLDLLFHRNLVMMSGNNPLLVAWNTMANIFQAILEFTNMTSLTYREFYDAHRKLADLIIQKNAACIDELTLHITNAKAIIVSRLETNLNNPTR